MVICLDYGERYVGIAVTDRDGNIALRHSVIDQKKEDALKEIIKLVNEEKTTHVLVGVPLGRSGKETNQTHTTLSFIEQVRAVLGHEVIVEGVDERLSSKEAGKRIAFEGGKPEDEHAEAARLLLQNYLKKESKEVQQN
jgi:putative holliday junction resolvase